MRCVCIYCERCYRNGSPLSTSHGICDDCGRSDLATKDLFAGVVHTARRRGVVLPTGHDERFELVADDLYVLTADAAAALLAGGVLPGDEPLLERTIELASAARMRAIERAIDPALARYGERRIGDPE